jgi:hypothetical protein
MAGSRVRTTRTTTAAAVKSLIVSAAPATLVDVTVQNVTATLKYVQLFNSATVPADTAVPDFVYQIAIDGHLVIDFSSLPEYFDTGVVVCTSSTDITKTLSATSDLFITARVTAS